MGVNNAARLRAYYNNRNPCERHQYLFALDALHGASTGIQEAAMKTSSGRGDMH